MPAQANNSAARPPAEAVREHLNKILEGKLFARSARQAKFLRYLVENAVAGQTDRLKESVLAVEVFGRRPTFDPHVDPIVRVEAGRLRAKLAQYYEEEGRDDRVIIEVPLRTYVPAFRERAPEPKRAALYAWFVRGRRWRVAALAGVAALVGLAVLGWRSGWFSTPPRVKVAAGAGHVPRTLVVLPFEDLSPSRDQEYLADGLTEELIEALARREDLRVVSRTSAFHYKHKRDDIRKIAEQLGVEMVLEGSVRRADQKVRVIAQLVNASDGYRLWSATYGREMKDAAVLPEEIARAIAGALRIGGAEGRPPQAYAVNPEARVPYLKGLHFTRQWAEEGLRAAIRYFEQALRADPKYAPAYAELAGCYALLAIHGASPPAEVMPKAKAAASRALALDPALAHAHVTLGLVKAVYDWDWAGARESFQRALELDPNDSGVLEAYVMAYLLPLGRLEEALRVARRAHGSDPVSPRIHSVLGLVYYYQRQYDQALDQYREALELAPHFSAAYLAMGSVYEQRGLTAEALAALERGRTTWSGGMGESLLAHAYAVRGRREEAQALLAQLTQLAKERYVSGAYLALIHLGLGEKAAALDWLEKAAAQRSGSLVYLKVNPRYESLRSEPRFSALLKKIGLE